MTMPGPTQARWIAPMGLEKAMSSINPAVEDQGITSRQAALIAGFGLLVMALAGPFAELFVYPSLVIPRDIERTTQNIAANKGLFLAGIFAYLTMFVCDVVVAWALYVLLIPVNRSLSLLAAWFRIVYAVIALSGLAKLVTVFRMLNTPEYLTVFGSDHLHAQVRLLLNSFQYEWGMGLVLFGVYLGLLGYLVWRSEYVPRILGILLTIAGLGWVIHSLRPYLYPKVNLEFVMITSSVCELIFMLWLLLRGWKIQEPTAHS